MVRCASLVAVSLSAACLASAVSGCEAPEANRAYAAQLEAAVAELKAMDAEKLKAEAETLTTEKKRLSSTWGRDGAAWPLDLTEGATVNATVDAGRKVVTVEGPGKPEDAAIVLSSVARHPALKMAAVGRMWVAEGKFAITLVEHDPPPTQPAAPSMSTRPPRSSDDALEKRIDALEAERAELSKLLGVDVTVLAQDRAWVAAAKKTLAQRPTPDGAFFAWLHRQLLSQDARPVRAVVTCPGAATCELELDVEGPTAGTILDGPLKPFIAELKEMKPGSSKVSLKASIKTPPPRATGKDQ